ncbi:MAG: DUF3267 domain-containing protein [Salinibacter sp.]
MTFAVMPLIRTQLLGVGVFLVLAAAGTAPYLLLWGSPPESGGPSAALLMTVVFGGIVVHEALHGVGYVWGGADRSEVEFGVDWSSLTPYAHCGAPLRCGPYRWAIALPGLALGVVPLLVGLAVGSWATVLLAALMLGAAGGDAMLLWMLRGVPGDAWVRDHPSKMGSLVLGHPASEVPPTLDFDLGENGLAENDPDDNVPGESSPGESSPDESSPGESEDTEGKGNSWMDWCKAVLFYCVFALLPFFLYEWIQEDVRPTVQAESLRDLYAVAPNGLGAISSTALLAIIVRPQIPTPSCVRGGALALRRQGGRMKSGQAALLTMHAQVFGAPEKW